jgi:hypothetical protein
MYLLLQVLQVMAMLLCSMLLHVAMLGPGASAFLNGFGPFRRYLQFLESQGCPIQHRPASSPLELDLTCQPVA